MARFRLDFACVTFRCYPHKRFASFPYRRGIAPSPSLTPRAVSIGISITLSPKGLCTKPCASKNRVASSSIACATTPRTPAISEAARQRRSASASSAEPKPRPRQAASTASRPRGFPVQVCARLCRWRRRRIKQLQKMRMRLIIQEEAALIEDSLQGILPRAFQHEFRKLLPAHCRRAVEQRLGFSRGADLNDIIPGARRCGHGQQLTSTG